MPYKLKKKREAQTYWIVHRKHMATMIRMILMYFVIVGALVLFTLQFDIPLGDMHSGIEILTPWGYLIQFVYYILPVIIAVLVGLLFPPVWYCLRDILFIITLVFGIYSLNVFAFRQVYLNEYNATIDAVGTRRVGIKRVSHREIDQDSDSRFERVEFTIEFDVSQLVPGNYTVNVFCTQYDEVIPDGSIGSANLKVRPGKRTIKETFNIDPEKVEDYFKEGPIDVSFEMRNTYRVDRSGLLVIALCRWAPLYRPVTWTGYDPYIKDTIIELGTVYAIDSFYLLPLRFSRNGMPVLLAAHNERDI